MNGSKILRINSDGRREKAELMLFQMYRAEVGCSRLLWHNGRSFKAYSLPCTPPNPIQESVCLAKANIV